MPNLYTVFWASKRTCNENNFILVETYLEMNTQSCEYFSETA